MKKRITAICALAMLLSVFSGCCLKHDWAPATCEAPEVCSGCGKTQGEPLGHSWTAATCEAPETCTVCAGTRGEPLGHSWTAATCEAPETCSVCGKTQGEPVHSWQAATCETPETCSLCGVTRGEPAAHTLQGKRLTETGETYTLTSICILCGTEIVEQTDDWNEASKQIILGDWVAIYAGVRLEEFYLKVSADGTVVFDIGDGPVTGTWQTLADYYDSAFTPTTLKNGGVFCQYRIEVGEESLQMSHISYSDGVIAAGLSKNFLSSDGWSVTFVR